MERTGSCRVSFYRDAVCSRAETIVCEPGKAIRDCVGISDERYCLVSVNGSLADCSYVLRDGDVAAVRQYQGWGTAIVLAVIAAAVVGDYLIHGCSWSETWTVKGLSKLAKWLVATDDTASSEDKETTPTISGTESQSAYGKAIPQIFGKTYMTPYVLGSPYVTIDTSTDEGKETFHCLYLVGYKGLQIRDICLGLYPIAKNDGTAGVSQSDYTTALSTDLESGYPALCSGSAAHYDPATYQIKLEIRQDAAESDLYPQKVVQEAHGAKINGYDYHCFSAVYPHKVEIQFKLNGLTAYNTKGKKRTQGVDIYISCSKDGGTTWQAFGAVTRADGYSVSGEWGVSRFNRASADEMRFVAPRTFAYSEVSSLTNDALELKVKAVEVENDYETKSKDVYIEYVRTWCYDPDASATAAAIVPQRPMVAARRDRTARIALSLIAGDYVQNTISSLNCICTSKARTWDGTAWTTAATPTNNPASMMLLAMQGLCRGNKPYPDARIDYDSLGAFYEWCADTTAVGDGLPRFSCNGALLSRTKTADVLKQIAACGRGSVVLNGDSYGVCVDSPRSIVTHVLNAQNIIKSANKKTFDDLPDGFECKFVNALNGYQEDSLTVWFDTSKSVENRIMESVEYPYITDARRVVKQAWYDYAVRRYRPEVWERKVGIDGNLIELGALVEIQGESISVGIGEGAEITSVVSSDGYITAIVTDGEFSVSDASQEYGVKIVIADGQTNPSVMTRKLSFSAAGIYRTLTFEQPISLDASVKPCVGDVVSFGLYDRIATQALCLGKKDNGDGTFDLYFVPYQSAVYTADSGKLPEYQSKLTTPAQAGLLIDDGRAATIDDINSGIEGLIDGDSTMIPDDVTSIAAAAEEGGISFSPVSVRTHLTDGVRYEYQLRKGSSASWADVEAENDFYEFDRSADGYPEKSALDAWGVRCKAVNVYGKESENWKEGTISTDGYGTWIAQPANVSASVNGRSIRLALSQPSNVSVYGSVRYKVEISRYDDESGGVRTWYKPNITADYLSSETAYRDGSGYVVATEAFQQTLPLVGQNTGDGAPEDTQYLYRITAYNEAGDGTAVITDPIAALAVSARDVVKAWRSSGGEKVYVEGGLKADNIYAENLAAICAIFGEISSGTRDNFWDLDKSEFRVGNNIQYEESGSDSAEYIHYVDGEFRMRLAKLVATLRDSTVDGSINIYNSDKTIRLNVSGTGIEFAKKNASGAFEYKGCVSLNANGSLLISNDPDATLGDAIPRQNETASVYHLDDDALDEDGDNPAGLTASGEYINTSGVMSVNDDYLSGSIAKQIATVESSYAQPSIRTLGYKVLGVRGGVAACVSGSSGSWTLLTVSVDTGATLSTATITSSALTDCGDRILWDGDEPVFCLMQDVGDGKYIPYIFGKDGTNIPRIIQVVTMTKKSIGISGGRSYYFRGSTSGYLDYTEQELGSSSSVVSSGSVSASGSGTVTVLGTFGRHVFYQLESSDYFYIYEFDGKTHEKRQLRSRAKSSLLLDGYYQAGFSEYVGDEAVDGGDFYVILSETVSTGIASGGAIVRTTTPRAVSLVGGTLYDFCITPAEYIANGRSGSLIYYVDNYELYSFNLTTGSETLVAQGVQYGWAYGYAVIMADRSSDGGLRRIISSAASASSADVFRFASQRASITAEFASMAFWVSGSVDVCGGLTLTTSGWEYAVLSAADGELSYAVYKTDGTARLSGTFTPGWGDSASQSLTISGRVDELWYDEDYALNSVYRGYMLEYRLPWGGSSAVLPSSDVFAVMVKDASKFQSNAVYKKSEVYTKSEVDAVIGWKVGCVYIQMQGTSSPVSLGLGGSSAVWTDITANYGGAFFRAYSAAAGTIGASGGFSESTPQFQSESLPNIVGWANMQMDYYSANYNNQGGAFWTESTITAVYPTSTSSGFSGGSNLNFKASEWSSVYGGSHVIPYNCAIKIWKRTA